MPKTMPKTNKKCPVCTKTLSSVDRAIRCKCGKCFCSKHRHFSKHACPSTTIIQNPPPPVDFAKVEKI